MFIVNPETEVLAFDLLDWLIEEESSPKTEVKKFLRSRYEDLVGKKVKENDESGDDDDEEDEEDEECSNKPSLKATLLTVTYSHFSLTEGGDILLIASEDNIANLLLTDADARDLLPKLKTAIENRATKLTRLLK
jgi:CO dehydrogenase/acetyl-CoA synthase beta subunit